MPLDHSGKLSDDPVNENLAVIIYAPRERSNTWRCVWSIDRGEDATDIHETMSAGAIDIGPHD